MRLGNLADYPSGLKKLLPSARPVQFKEKKKKLIQDLIVDEKVKLAYITEMWLSETLLSPNSNPLIPDTASA